MRWALAGGLDALCRGHPLTVTDQAGGHGRGLAVVAKEVGALADAAGAAAVEKVLGHIGEAVSAGSAAR